MTESRPPKIEDSIDHLGDPDATHDVQESASAEDTIESTNADAESDEEA
ncbi:hypothetical protein CGLAU_10040 [Corynebacterium glaucum]|uniref:Uncharacterized protein n=1 Tax=Corynebacterium glaucum TaxID=187491 RepID=A0A1Q2HYL4_9CORY|nr:hypothetical protein [Corynebacterium glaucum]AQQ15956.1 hypothetical protein CGLAU_10040 [Corynebacterium glaucum]WJZ08437.1 hypothetical protein CGLAUT_09825 [Corynebacterium glaucum]